MSCPTSRVQHLLSSNSFLCMLYKRLFLLCFIVSIVPLFSSYRLFVSTSFSFVTRLYFLLIDLWLLNSGILLLPLNVSILPCHLTSYIEMSICISFTTVNLRLKLLPKLRYTLYHALFLDIDIVWRLQTRI